ncbi:tyrosine-type recombinase/integrase [Mycoplasma sp. 4079]|uniref:tyrosine-type recombinase/integrase n=1 Tax=Mycoplasma sp. 4079 TaxID=3398615 RepID=UPI0039FBBD17
MDLKEYSKIYVNNLHNSKTRQTYKYFFDNFFKCFTTPEPSNEELKKVIKDYRDRLKPTSQQTFFSMLKSLITKYNQLEQKFVYDVSIIPNIKTVKAATYVPDVVELSKIKKYALNYDNSKGVASFVLFAIENGARFSEICNVLANKDNFVYMEEIEVYSSYTQANKNNNFRAYNISKEYWPLYEEFIDNSKFPRDMNYQFTRFITELKRDLPEFADKPITIHTFRKAFVTNQYRNNTDIVKIQKSTGHKDTTTLINTYIIQTPEELAKIVKDATDPARLKLINQAEMMREIEQLRDFKDIALINEKKQLALLEAERLENQKLAKENEKLRKQIELLERGNNENN